MLPSIWWLGPQGFLPYRERRRKSTLRRVQLEGGWSPKGFSPIKRGGEKTLHEECGYKKAWIPGGPPL
jgi:hypothetical protein